MKLFDVIESVDVLDLAFKHAKLKVTSRTKKFPDLEKAQGVVMRAIEDLTIETLANTIKEALHAAYETHVMLEGDHEESATPDEWEEAMDIIVEGVLEPYVEMLSNDWLGTHTIASGIHLEGGLDTFCRSFGKEMYKQYKHDRKPDAILADVGISEGEIDRWLQEHIAKNRKPAAVVLIETKDDEPGTVAYVISKMANHLGKEFDILAVYDDLDLASDDDEILMTGAIPRLGIDADDASTLSFFRMMEGGDKTPSLLSDMLTAYFAPKKSKAKKKADPVKAKLEPQVLMPDGSPNLGSEIPAVVLRNLKDFGGAKDTSMAKALGVSRGTYGTWIKGGSQKEVTPDQYDYMRHQLLDRLNALHTALAALDGTEAHVVL